MRWRKKTRKLVPPPRTRADLEQEFSNVWNTQELAHEFVITSIIGNTVIVRRKVDDQVGTLHFQNDPALYYGFKDAPTMETETSK